MMMVAVNNNNLAAAVVADLELLDCIADLEGKQGVVELVRTVVVVVGLDIAH